MPSTSTVPTSKTAILAAIATRSALTGIQQEWAHPGPSIEAESIFLGGVESNDEPATMGNQKRDEFYTVEVIVSVQQGGDDAKTIEVRMWALVAEVEQAIRADSTLGAAVLSAQIAGKTQRPYIGPEERISEAVVRVKCRARI